MDSKKVESNSPIQQTRPSLPSKPKRFTGRFYLKHSTAKRRCQVTADSSTADLEDEVFDLEYLQACSFESTQGQKLDCLTEATKSEWILFGQRIISFKSNLDLFKMPNALLTTMPVAQMR